MDNIYKDFKPSLNEIENQNKPLTSLLKSDFKLSPHAPAFVPRFAISSSGQSSSLAQQQMQASYYDNPEYQQNFPGLGSVGNGFNEQSQQMDSVQLNNNNLENTIELSNDVLKEDDYYALNELNNFIENISKNPALYEANVQMETDVLNNWILEDPDIIMECVVNNIMDQAIMDNNFRYNGVRFCLHLIGNLHVTSSKGSFKQVLLQRCKREHSRRDTLSSASDNGLYLRGLTFFIGDLSMKMNEPELTLTVPDLLKTLLQNKLTDNVKCCCQILKLCGKHLTEHLKSQGSVEILDSLIDELKSLLDKPETEKSVKELIKIVVELYKNNWIPPQSSAPIYNPYAKSNLNNPTNQINPMHQYNQQINEYDNNNFNPTPTDSNEFTGYDFGDCGDGNNDDVCDAFEEFLKASGQM